MLAQPDRSMSDLLLQSDSEYFPASEREKGKLPSLTAVTTGRSGAPKDPQRPLCTAGNKVVPPAAKMAAVRYRHPDACSLLSLEGTAKGAQAVTSAI